jgi:hypothetical protein
MTQTTKERVDHTPLRYHHEPTQEYERHAHKEYIKYPMRTRFFQRSFLG